MHDLFDIIPKDFLYFVLTALFSLLIGLEQRRRFWNKNKKTLIGTDRTFAFVGMAGYIFYIISPNHLYLYALGFIGILSLVIVFYWKKIDETGNFGVTTLITFLITYGIAPLLYTQPTWLVILIITTVLVMSEMKEHFKAISGKFDDDEFITLATFLIMSGVVLPLLPDKIIIKEIPVSPFKFWLAIVVVSGISYISYILQKFIFPKRGIIITAILGGLYSSTATTIVLAQKSKNSSIPVKQITAGIIMATGMMFLRVLVIAFIFNYSLGVQLSLPIFILIALTFLIGIINLKLGRKESQISLTEEEHRKSKNPLEFKTALIFALLFVLFAAITQFVIKYYGAQGLKFLSFVVGVTDIDPFLLSLFTGKFSASLNILSSATLIAVTSNNLMKWFYSLLWGHNSIKKKVSVSFIIILAISILVIIFV